jgi:hypothetical protein
VPMVVTSFVRYPTAPSTIILICWGVFLNRNRLKSSIPECCGFVKWLYQRSPTVVSSPVSPASRVS